jgi:hypothetical protein
MQPEKDPQSESSAAEKRKFERFRSTAFLGTPLTLKPLPPLFREPIEGQVIDLSGGGMAILISESLPASTTMQMELIFPNKVTLGCLVVVRRTSGCTGGYLTGIEFLDMPEGMIAKIDRMAHDYNACDGRIANQDEEEDEICQPECSFMSVCDKPQKLKTPPASRSIKMQLKPLE